MEQIEKSYIILKDSVEKILRKKLSCKKKITSLFFRKSKNPDIQVVENNICDKLYRRDF